MRERRGRRIGIPKELEIHHPQRARPRGGDRQRRVGEAGKGEDDFLLKPAHETTRRGPLEPSGLR
jgi:hypothetical protein